MPRRAMLMMILAGSAVSACAGGVGPPPPRPVTQALKEDRAVPIDPANRALLDAAESDRLAYEQAVAADSNAGLIMFLARNPDSPHADAVRHRLAARRTPDPPAVIRALAGADADVVAEFDAARLAGDPAALRAFIARHGSHPLGAEARRLLP
jgi:hypothetical protein